MARQSSDAYGPDAAVTLGSYRSQRQTMIDDITINIFGPNLALKRRIAVSATVSIE